MTHHLRAFGPGVLLTLGCVVGYSQLDRILKAGGIALAVDRFGGGMDRALNRLTNTKPDKNFATKVVPILSAGNGAHIGAAQVMGKPELVRKVQAVAQVVFTEENQLVLEYLPAAMKPTRRTVSEGFPRLFLRW